MSARELKSCVNQYSCCLLQINEVLGVRSISRSCTMRLSHRACQSIVQSGEQMSDSHMSQSFPALFSFQTNVFSFSTLGVKKYPV